MTPFHAIRTRQSCATAAGGESIGDLSSQQKPTTLWLHRTVLASNTTFLIHLELCASFDISQSHVFISYNLIFVIILIAGTVFIYRRGEKGIHFLLSLKNSGLAQQLPEGVAVLLDDNYLVRHTKLTAPLGRVPQCPSPTAPFASFAQGVIIHKLAYSMVCRVPMGCILCHPHSTRLILMALLYRIFPTLWFTIFIFIFIICFYYFLTAFTAVQDPSNATSIPFYHLHLLSTLPSSWSRTFDRNAYGCGTSPHTNYSISTQSNAPNVWDSGWGLMHKKRRHAGIALSLHRHILLLLLLFFSSSLLFHTARRYSGEDSTPHSAANGRRRSKRKELYIVKYSDTFSRAVRMDDATAVCDTRREDLSDTTTNHKAQDVKQAPVSRHLTTPHTPLHRKNANKKSQQQRNNKNIRFFLKVGVYPLQTSVSLFVTAVWRDILSNNKPTTTMHTTHADLKPAAQRDSVLTTSTSCGSFPFLSSPLFSFLFFSFLFFYTHIPIFDTHPPTRLPPTPLPPTPFISPSRPGGSNAFITSALDPVGHGAALSSMVPVLHFANQDTSVMAVQHNTHFHLLAILTSDNEIYMTGTQNMPFEQIAGERYRCLDSLNASQGGGGVAGADVQVWDPARHTICIDALPYRVTQLGWAPWQNGIYLAALCPGRGLHLYRYSHSRWTREDLLPCPACTQFAFAPAGVFTRRSGAAWAPRASTPASAPAPADPAADVCLCVAWDGTGLFVCAGFSDGTVRVFSVLWQGAAVRLTLCCRMSAPDHHPRVVAAQPPPLCQQLAWAPPAGRSFLVLLAAFTHGVIVTLFRRPPGVSDCPGDHLGAAHQRSTPIRLEHVVSVPLQCQEVINVVWNSTGTRFVTSHRDSSVNVWRMEVAHQQRRADPLTGSRGIKAEPPPLACQFSAPTVTVRHVSSRSCGGPSSGCLPRPVCVRQINNRNQQTNSVIVHKSKSSASLTGLNCFYPSLSFSLSLFLSPAHIHRSYAVYMHHGNPHGPAPLRSRRRRRNPPPPTATAGEDKQALATLNRLMHAQPRSDRLQVRRCRLNRRLCERAAEIFQQDFTQNPVRCLTLQLGCRTDAPAEDQRRAARPIGDGMQLLLPLIFHHRLHLRELDLSRNDLCAADVRTLCAGLGLTAKGSSQPPPLRLLDLSYNCRVGNEGVMHLFHALVWTMMALPHWPPLLRGRPAPCITEGETAYSQANERHAASFLLNLNENRIGAEGTRALGRSLPSYVSLTVCKQMIRPAAPAERTRATPSLGLDLHTLRTDFFFFWMRTLIQMSYSVHSPVWRIHSTPGAADFSMNAECTQLHFPAPFTSTFSFSGSLLLSVHVLSASIGSIAGAARAKTIEHSFCRIALRGVG
eukprot:gene7277-5121_t